MTADYKIGVIDLFCGIGGLSHGMYRTGFKIIAGFDIDETCKYAYETNNKAVFYGQDINTISKEQINNLFAGYDIKILAGCAPCQPFSSYAFKVKDKDDKKYNLLYQFGRLVKEVLPDIVTMENVSQYCLLNRSLYLMILFLHLNRMVIMSLSKLYFALIMVSLKQEKD